MCVCVVYGIVGWECRFRNGTHVICVDFPLEVAPAYSESERVLSAEHFRADVQALHLQLEDTACSGALQRNTQICIRTWLYSTCLHLQNDYGQQPLPVATRSLRPGHLR